jgi:hypothetical protein
MKPGRPVQASIQDHGWFTSDPATREPLRPLEAFLDALLGPADGA